MFTVPSALARSTNVHLKDFPMTTTRDTQSTPGLNFQEQISSKKYLNAASYLTVDTLTVSTTQTKQLVPYTERRRAYC